jgi:galactose mutarotase-like enzyme
LATTKIENEFISATVESRGAELQSLTRDGLEYLWQGDPESWERRSPVLFPIIGALPGGRYTVDGVEYELGNHGFARERSFSVSRQDASSVELQTQADEESLRIYPYRFELRLLYQLKGPRLALTYTVRNLDERPILFSIGGHPGFNVPLEPGLEFQDYRLRFEKNETVDRRLKAAFLTGQTEAFLRNETTSPLSHNLFERGPVILQGLRSKEVTLESSKARRSVTVDFEGFPYLGIWSHLSRPPFVCIEPWYGVDSTVGDPPDYQKKEGLERLEVGEVFSATFGITLT